jgi:hypothetical protein
MGKLGSGTRTIGSIPVRQVAPPVKTPDAEIDTPSKYTLIALNRIHEDLAGLGRQLENQTLPVDEYQVNSIYNQTTLTTSVEVLPQFEISEKIQSIFITGPVSTACVLTLGDRSLNMATDATGTITIAPVAFLLDRSERRILTSVTPGNWTLELMGYADVRY